MAVDRVGHHVAFPVPGHGPVIGLSGASADVQGVDDLTAALTADADPPGRRTPRPLRSSLDSSVLSRPFACTNSDRQSGCRTWRWKAVDAIHDVTAAFGRADVPPIRRPLWQGDVPFDFAP